MGRIAVVTDSNSGITQQEGKELGIFVLPMPFYIDEKLYFEDITLTQQAFYQLLATDASISTSQPSPGDVTDLWDRVLQDYDEIVHIPMSSGLSTSCATAIMLAEDYNGRVHVVDNQRISVTMRQSVMDALTLIQKGLSGAQVAARLMETKMDSSIYITVDTLKYLKKGGRITPAAAAIGSVLNLKPVLQIQGEKLDAYKKVRGMKAAKAAMIDAIRSDLETRFADLYKAGQIRLSIAYTGASDEAAQEWKKELEAAFPNDTFDVMDPLSLSVSCHIGAGSLAVTISRILS